MLFTAEDTPGAGGAPLVIDHKLGDRLAKFPVSAMIRQSRWKFVWSGSCTPYTLCASTWCVVRAASVDMKSLLSTYTCRSHADRICDDRIGQIWLMLFDYCYATRTMLVDMKKKPKGGVYGCPGRAAVGGRGRLAAV